MCVYIYIYICIYIHTYIYIHIYGADTVQAGGQDARHGAEHLGLLWVIVTTRSCKSD